ncbi:MAG: DUF1638 domain-containing protein [Methanomassiliicoccales archaeon]|nr:DUF1638 domain-containing protein [Methanomassiliicoccales archaeon]
MSGRIGVVACETFKQEIEHLLQGQDGDVAYKEYLEFGLHEYPEELKRAVVDKVNSLKGRVDAVFLGYGICQSLKGITSRMEVPTVMLDADDCIGALITSDEYERERKKCAGTWYATPFFCEKGEAWFEKKLIHDLGEEQARTLEEQGYDNMWFLRQLFNGYSRALFIDTKVGEREYFESLSRKFADKLNLRHESRDGTLEVLEEGLRKTRALANGC